VPPIAGSGAVPINREEKVAAPQAFPLILVGCHPSRVGVSDMGLKWKSTKIASVVWTSGIF
jgi:hypothetical protein